MLTNLKSTGLLVRACAVLGLAAGVAGAQVAPPPPADAPVEPVYTPKPLPERAAPTNQVTGKRTQTLPTNVPYPKLARVGPDGKIIRLKELPDILALRSNPTVGEQSVDGIMPILISRRARFEQLVIENLDLYWELSGGALDNLDMTDLKEMSRITEMLKPMVGKTTLSEELENRKILTRVQGGMNQHIVQEYKKAVGDEIQASQGNDGITEFMRFILQDSLHEARLAYQGMLVEAKSKAVELLDRAGIVNEQVSALNGMISSDSDVVEQEVDAFDAAVRTMSVDEGIRFFTAMRDSRDNPLISPTVTRINVLHDRKIMYDSGMKGRVLESGDKMPGGGTFVKQGANPKAAQDKPADEQPGDN